ncbi:hypothetical protein H0H81_001225 [Sphagnurus paluster]|uniref:Uncharacterized protein n=1 Tax=Sphagnurus paluster TaxID=117069 RepID=A0A9P7FW70_9AGAR|nr:hypothetical protein H0H81_001225 [Sphagnurus paluster]
MSPASVRYIRVSMRSVPNAHPSAADNEGKWGMRLESALAVRRVKEHNQRCYQILTPYLKDDKRASKWLKREAERLIGIANGPAGFNIDWD